MRTCVRTGDKINVRRNVIETSRDMGNTVIHARQACQNIPSKQECQVYVGMFLASWVLQRKQSLTIYMVLKAKKHCVKQSTWIRRKNMWLAIYTSSF